MSGESVTTERPFAATAGRDVTKDVPAPFDPARAYYDERLRVAVDLPTLRRLMGAVDWTNDLTPPQWAQWYSVALAYRPDLVLELGRGRGNSTALFCEAAEANAHGQVISLCHSGDWTLVTAPRLAKVVGARWFDRVDARMTDIVTADYADILGDHRRILLLWDAHGFDIAEVVLGEILPRLRDREHLVIMHDIGDNRYAGVSRSYGGQPLWKGAEWQQRTGSANARVNIGWMHAIQDQVIAISDFSSRNDVEIESADHQYARFFAAHPGRADEMRAQLGDEFFSSVGQWAFFTLNGKAGPIEFPAVAGRRMFTGAGSVVLDDPARLPATIVTAAQPWVFASAWKWRPAAAVPAGVDAWLRVRLHVENASVGIGLLGANGRDFTVRRAISADRKTIQVLLPVADPANPDSLVIHTWAAPFSARVRVEALDIVW